MSSSLRSFFLLSAFEKFKKKKQKKEEKKECGSAKEEDTTQF
jgi:hypothetical protein